MSQCTHCRETRSSIEQVSTTITELRRSIERAAEPPVRSPLTLSATAPTARLDGGTVYRGLGVINTGPVTTYVATDGSLPRSGTGALAVPPGGILTIPTRVESVEIGFDPADLGAVLAPYRVEVLRYHSCPPLQISATEVGVTG